jgi:beta-alanine--pyruvate transaminase
MSAQPTLDRSQLEAFWMPFTANRQFKANPRLLARASGMHYWTADGRQVLDGCAGCGACNAGHSRKEITAAVSEQIATMEYAPPFQMGHPAAFETRERRRAVAARRSRSRVFRELGSEASTRRSRSRSPTTACRARARARG